MTKIQASSVSYELFEVFMVLTILYVHLLVSVDGFPTGNIEASGELEQSFRHYLKNIPGSTIVGHLNSNATEEELMVLRKKIADTILGMQQLEREKEERRLQDGSKALETAEPECYIEVTRVERVPGRCHKVIGGSPICLSDPYLALSSGCTSD